MRGYVLFWIPSSGTPFVQKYTSVRQVWEQGGDKIPGRMSGERITSKPQTVLVILGAAEPGEPHHVNQAHGGKQQYRPHSEVIPYPALDG